MKERKVNTNLLIQKLGSDMTCTIVYVLVVGIDRKIAGDYDYASDEFHKVT